MSYLKQLEPLGLANQILQANVRPLDWTNPTPSGRYNLVVIGAGTAGLVTAAGAAARISPNDSAARFRDLGVDVYFGQASFVDSNTVAVDGTRLNFKRAVIATGARASAPSIPGLNTVNYLTNETFFSLTALPPRLGVIGAGPIGCEITQTFAQLGSKVLLIESSTGILPREDRDAAAIVEQAMLHDGVKLVGGGKNLSIQNQDGVRLSGDANGIAYNEYVDQLLVSVGRAPNVENLNLEAVGVEFTPKGVVVNNRMQTTNPMIYAAGDVCSSYQFTHAADFMARIVIQNSLFKGRRKSTSLIIPWCTYTSPEIAHVGLYEHQAKEKNIPIDTYMQKLHDVDRAAMFASISIHQFAFAETHSICGPWGCGPSNGALISVHVGWLTAIWPPLVYLPWRFGWNYLLCQRLGILLASIGVAGVLGVIAWQWIVWLPQAGEFSRAFLWQRCGFAIATSVDWPLAQLIGIGAILIATSRTGQVKAKVVGVGED